MHMRKTTSPNSHHQANGHELQQKLYQQDMMPVYEQQQNRQMVPQSQIQRLSYSPSTPDQQYQSQNNSRLNKVEQKLSQLADLKLNQKDMKDLQEIVEKQKNELSNNSTFSKFCRWIHIFLVLFYSVGTVVVFSILYYYFPQKSDLLIQLSELTSNWDLEAIESIQVINSSGTCQSGYTGFFSFQGQSFIQGCNCLSSSYSNPQLITGTCTQTMTKAGCIDSAPFTGTKGVYWKTPDNIVFSICAKRMSGVSYSEFGSKVSCDKQCGGTASGTKFCVKSSDLCPINLLQISSTVVAGATGLSIAGSTYSIYFSNTATSSLPIVETRITKGAGVCLDNLIQNLYSTSYIHPLLNKYYTQQCSVTDTRFSSLLTQNEQSIFDANSLTNTYSQIPSYVISLTENYGLYVRSYIPLVDDSRSKISTICELRFTFDQVYHVTEAILITSILYLVFVGIIYNIFSLLNILSKQSKLTQFLYEINPGDLKPKSNLFKRLWLKVFLFFRFCLIIYLIDQILMSIVHLTAIIVAFALLLHYKKNLDGLKEGVIGDSYTVSLFKGLSTELFDKIFWQIVGSFIYFVSLITLELLALIPLCSKKLKEDTSIKISKKYKSNNYISRNTPNQELAEYQAYNIYGGGGINTTMNPFIDPNGGNPKNQGNTSPYYTSVNANYQSGRFLDNSSQISAVIPKYNQNFNQSQIGVDKVASQSQQHPPFRNESGVQASKNVSLLQKQHQQQFQYQQQQQHQQQQQQQQQSDRKIKQCESEEDPENSSNNEVPHQQMKNMENLYEKNQPTTKKRHNNNNSNNNNIYNNNNDNMEDPNYANQNSQKNSKANQPLQNDNRKSNQDNVNNRSPQSQYIDYINQSPIKEITIDGSVITFGNPKPIAQLNTQKQANNNQQQPSNSEIVEALNKLLLERQQQQQQETEQEDSNQLDKVEEENTGDNDSNYNSVVLPSYQNKYP